ncbi:MAG: HTH-type transcriptional regulator PrtR [Syntrophaceae bacterium PtaU1.Bin231]|nr:MAG: HTH-type transcriptional regulator PrtR [Syntrophaceae bacterium PtaU1.Bin231]
MLDELSKRIAWAIETIKADKDLDKGIQDIDLAKKLGTNKNTLADYRHGKGLLKGEVIDNIVKIYNFSPSWLFKGLGEPFPGARAKYPEFCGPESSSPFPDNGAPGEFVYVPQMGGRISAGGGLVPDNTVEMKIAFRKAWIQRRGDPANMTLIKVSGDSMEPTLLSGDLVLIDRSRNYLDPQGGIYAIALDDAIMIKRLLADPSRKIRIISDNRNYPAIEADPDQVKINGKVIWFGRELER